MKIIVCDMSGIITNRGENNTLLLKTLQNLKTYKSSFCTGKGYRGAYSSLQGYTFELPFICENGSVIVSLNGEVLYNDKMDSVKAIELIKKISKYPFEFLAYIDLTTHKYKFLRGSKPLSEALTQPWFYSDEIFDNVEDFLKHINTNNICRITTRGLELTESEQYYADFHIVVSENEFHSICNHGISKGSGVIRLAKILHINMEDIIIIGNDVNDIDMFRLEGCYKIATGINQPPAELLQLADIFVDINKLPLYLEQLDLKEKS